MSRVIHLLVNPVSGVGDNRSILERVRPVLEERGCTVGAYEPSSAEDARDWVLGLPAGPEDALCVLGGDGTLHLAVNTMMRRPEAERLPIGVLPGGTGNALMTDRDLLDPVAAARQITSGEPTPLDLMEVQSGEGIRYAFNLAAYGLVVNANMRAERLRFFGRRRYDLAVAWEVMFHRYHRATLQVEDEPGETDDFTFIAGLNTIHTGAGMRFAPRARLCDGLIDLIVVRKTTRRRLLAMLPEVYHGRHVDFPELEYRQVRSFRVESEAGSPLNIDGEIAGATPMNVRILPGALELM